MGILPQLPAAVFVSGSCWIEGIQCTSCVCLGGYSDEQQMLLKEVNSFTACRRKVLVQGESWLNFNWEG